MGKASVGEGERRGKQFWGWQVFRKGAGANADLPSPLQSGLGAAPPHEARGTVASLHPVPHHARAGVLMDEWRNPRGWLQNASNAVGGGGYFWSAVLLASYTTYRSSSRHMEDGGEVRVNNHHHHNNNNKNVRFITFTPATSLTATAELAVSCLASGPPNDLFWPGSRNATTSYGVATYSRYEQLHYYNECVQCTK